MRIEKIWTHEHEAAFLESAPAYLHLPLLLGFWGVLFDRERRGWPDRRSHTVVCYADPELDKDLA